MKEKIGIFGCTADPFTTAHREIVKQVLERHIVDAVIIAPTIVDWHRAGKTQWLRTDEKIEVIKAMTKGLCPVYIDDTELKRKELCSGSKNLTEHAVKSWRFIDTLLRIKLDRYSPDREFWPIIGVDELLNFKTWFAWQDILSQSGGIIAVVGRSGSEFDEKLFLKENTAFEGKLKTVDIDSKFAGVSASAVRGKYMNSGGPEEYVKDALAEIDGSADEHVLLHTPIFDIVRGAEAETGLKPILVKAPDWVTVIVQKGHNVLTVKQFRYGAGEEIEEFPCGMVEPGEDPLDAAVRELREETGISVFDKSKVIKLGLTNPNPAFMTNTMHYFYVDLDYAKYAEFSQKLDEHERISFSWKDRYQFMSELVDAAYCRNGRKVPAIALAAVRLYEDMLNRPSGC